MSRELSPPHSRLAHGLFDLNRAANRAQQCFQATSGRVWWWTATGVLVLGGAAAGLHIPVSGAWFWNLANGAVIRAHGLDAAARYLAQPGAALDLRTWLVDLGLFLIYSRAGLTGFAITGALGGALVGIFLLLAIRATGRAHPLIALVAGGLGLGALAPVLTDLPAEVLALLAAVLVLALATASRPSWSGPAILVGLVLLWTNVQADAGVAVLVIWGWLIVAHWDASRPGRAPAPSWWLIPLTGLALMLSPRGFGTVTELPLSLGMQGEHPLLAAWSSIDFHPWSARVAELAGMVLLISYWLAGSRLRRADAYLGLITVLLALLWANYLPWFLVVVAVQASWYLSIAWVRPPRCPQSEPTLRAGRARFGSLAVASAAIPLVVALALLGTGVAAATRSGGVRSQAAVQLPVQAARWLAVHPTSGAWFTTPQFGDYLASQFPSGRHLLCTDDPVAMATRALEGCQALTVLNAGALTTLRALNPTLAVLPRAAPAATFLLAEGWEIRYRDATTVILVPRNL